MKMTFRWYGRNTDPIPLKYVKQIPGMTGLMGLLEKPAGVDWPEDEFVALKKEVNDANNNSGNLQQNTQKDNNADTDVKSNTSEPQNVKQEEQVDKVVFDGVKPLEIIVTEHYGDHDKVFQVIDYNKKHGVFSDWTKIPVGTEILLPKL